MSELLPAIVQEPPGPADAAVIWLHGLGADGHDFAPIPPELGLGTDHGVRFVFPHAPRRPVTVNMGMVMPAWYDIRSLDARGQDEKGIRSSEQQVRALVARERERGIVPERIVLAGFSQGGAIALHTGLRYPDRLAGLMVLSAYLPMDHTLADELAEANRSTPVFQAHGTDDPMVPVALAETSKRALERQRVAVEWHTYPMAHQVCFEEIQDIGRWLRGVLDLG